MRDPIAQALKASLGGYAKNGNPEAAAIARRELEIYKLARQIKNLVSVEPPLTDEQRQRLTDLLVPAVAA